MPNVEHLLDQHLEQSQLKLLQRASVISQEHGVELLLVGGTVRDILRGGQPYDIDMVIVGDVVNFAKTLSENLNGEIVSSSQFGTSKLAIHGSLIDLAVARKESYAHPGALPSVIPSNINDDLARRDFSINSMAISLNNRWGKLIDPFNGNADLKRGLVRTLHANSFVEDPTRILRAIRYTHRIGFRLESETERLLKQGIQYIPTVSSDRIRHEISLIFRENRVVEILSMAQELRILYAIHPSLHMNHRTLTQLRSLLRKSTPDLELGCLAMMVFSVPYKDMESVICRLNMNNTWTTVAQDVATIKKNFDRLKLQSIRPSEVHNILQTLNTVSIDACALVADNPSVRQQLKLYRNKLKYTQTILNGSDLINLGVPDGPEVGAMLEKLLTAKLDGLLSVREDEERLVAHSLQKDNL